MSSRFVRASKFRHVFGTPYKKENCYDNIKVTRSAHDSNVIKVNPLFISVNLEAGGGGAFLVHPLDKPGKLAPDVPVFNGHTAAVLDTDFNPFNDYVIASGSEDTKVMIWNIPQGGLTENCNTPAVVLNGHGRKVGNVLFHPTAENVLATASFDLTIKLWDITTGQEKLELLGHLDFVQSMSWNWNGNLLATTSKDKKVRLFDVRSNKVVQEVEAHQGVKGARCCWLGNSNKIVTTGFSKTSDRQYAVWDQGDFTTPLKSENIDTSSGVIMPFYDNDSNVLFLAGKVKNLYGFNAGRWKHSILRNG
jgi:coronin-1B/1C/6